MKRKIRPKDTLGLCDYSKQTDPYTFQWSAYRTIEKEELDFFKIALEGVQGISYNPQLVRVKRKNTSGMNYCFLCEASFVGLEDCWMAYVEIYKSSKKMTPILIDICRK